MTLRRLAPALTATAAIAVLGIAGCSSDEGEKTASPNVSPSAPAKASSSCPSTPAEPAATPDWEYSGTSGSVKVVGSTDTAGPLVTVDGAFSVDATQIQTLKAGDGAVVAPTATVLVCYEGVNGRDGKIFDSSYQRGEPVEFPLNGVVAGFSKAIAGQKVGSTVAVAMIPADGYPQGQPSAGIEPTDTLVFAIKILDATN